MKRILVVTVLVVFCLAAAGYQPLHKAWVRRQQAQEAKFAEDHTPLVLDAKTQAILAGADRVEVFRLVDFHEEENYSQAEYAEMSQPHPQSFGDHQVLRAGSPQGKVFAASLQKALSEASGAEDAAGCFDPGVGFRAWKGAAHTDICVCFYCSGVQIITPGTSAKSQNSYNLPTMLGRSRPAFLALSKQAFPQDARLARLS